MYRWTRCWTCCLVALSLSLVCQLGEAGERSASKYLNAGIHAYRQGRYFDAITQLNQASSLNAHDPRVYFYRGLANDRIGNQGGAEADYQLGAQLEVVHGKQDVGLFLQRVQGGDRVNLERIRRQVRASAPAMLAQMKKQMTDSAANVGVPSVEPPEPTPAPPQQPIDYSAFTTLPADASDPFSTETEGFLLGRGKIEPADELAANNDGLDEAFGTGVAEESEFDAGDFVATDEGSDDMSGDEADFDDGTNDFADGDFGDEDFGSDFSDASDEAPAADQPKKKRGIFGAALRAFGRTVTPDVNISIPLGPPGAGGPPPGMGPDAMGPPDMGNEGFDDGQDLGDEFGDEDFGDDDFDADEFDMDDEGTPFGDDPI